MSTLRTNEIKMLDDRGTGSFTFDSVADLKDASQLKVGQKVRTLGYYSPGDGGGNDYEIVAAGTGTDDGGSFIDLSGSGLQAKGLFVGKEVHIEQFGAGGGDDDSALAGAIGFCVANEVRYLTVDSDITVTTVPSGFYNVILVGDGSISGAYRRWVYPHRTFDKKTGWLIPELHLSQFKSKAETGTPKVVLFGDSLLTYLANSLGRQNTLAYMIESKFKMEYPDVNIDFVNRSIGGKSWDTALDVADTGVDWYTDDTKIWIDYVKDEAPDVVIVSLGMNGANNFNIALIEDFVAYLETWTTPPDIIFCTTLVPTIEAHPNYSQYSSVAAQEDRDNVSGFIRTFCINRGYGLIDVNRVHNALRDGFDIFDTHLKSIESALDVTASGGNYWADIETRGYHFRGEIRGTSEEITKVFDGTNGTLGATTGNDRHGLSTVFIRAFESGIMYLDFYSGSGVRYERINTGITLPTSRFNLHIEVRANVFLMRLEQSGTSRDIVRFDGLRSPGGSFKPKFGYQTDAYITGPFYEVYFDAALPEIYMPSLTNDEVWGKGDSSSDTKLPYGGNGINHPTSIGANVIYGKALEDIKLR